ncbi:MAG: glycoside hydrolase family 3 C-terminal domain-containing protein [Ignavibacteriales bacterium]|nr:MAG: glycoside hydrolase family 3 C-terminal domain-containing protein [Ignavibacteriales bacterium]
MTEKIVNGEIQVDVLDYKNPALPVKQRVIDLISKMTLEEKVAQMLCIWGDKNTILFDETGNLNSSVLDERYKNGIGHIGRLSDTAGGVTPATQVELANTLQRFFAEETRLGIPVIFHEECLHGLAGKEATSYPQPIGLASTFNTELIKDIYASIAKEAGSRGVHQALSPVVDVARDPRWGRVEETFGEDPYLVSQMGIAAVRGLQGDNDFSSHKNLAATLKHFAAHGQPESGSNCGPANFSERVLHDVFLFPFKEVLKKADAISVMASYNEIDGVPSHSNNWLLKKILRQDWGFTGAVVSDYYAVTELNNREDTFGHSVASDKSEAAKIAALAGVNIELPDPDCYPALYELVKNGELSESVLDELITPMLELKFRMGLFENPYISFSETTYNTMIEKHRDIALKSAYETMVLLKNENEILPLDEKKLKSIAVIGPNADRKLLGGYSGEPKYYTTVLEGIKEKAGRKINVLYSEGCKITIGGSWNDDEVVLADTNENEQLISEAVEVAKNAEVVILALGGNEQTSREAWKNIHLGDRPSLELIGEQSRLFNEIKKLGKPVIVLLFNGRPNSVNHIYSNANALFECWYLGQETGKAVADVLFGEVNPSGKLPISFPRSAGHIPCYYNYKPSARRGYLFDDISPLFSFGYGLSYSKFEFSNLKVNKNSISENESVIVTVDVKNAGSYKGEEVVQLYIRDMVSSVTRPVKELKGFKKISVEPGQMKTVTFEISSEHLAFTNIDMKYVVEPGEFEIMIGNSSRNEDLLKVTFLVK